MVTRIPKIENGIRTDMFLSSDNQYFREKDEAEWHEFTKLQLKERTIKFEMPTHVIYSFPTKELLVRYLSENYGHLKHIVKVNVEDLVFPNNYVLLEKEILEDGYNVHYISIKELEAFKRDLASELLSL